MRYAFVAVLLIAAVCFGDPHYVDLSKVATTSLENDGNTGWANEGINDMFVYPPIPSGEVTRNGYKFNLPKPAKKAEGKNVKLSEDKKKVTITTSAEDFFEDVSKLEFRIEY